MFFFLPTFPPAVTSVGNIELPLQVDHSQGCATSSDIVDLLLPFDLNILLTAHTERKKDRKKEREREGGRVCFLSLYLFIKNITQECSNTREMEKGVKDGNFPFA